MSNTYKNWITTNTSIDTSTITFGGNIYGYKFYTDMAKPPAPKPRATDSNTHRSTIILAMYPRKQKEGYESSQVYREISFSNTQELLAKFFLGIHYEQGLIRNWREYCIGATSHFSGRDPLTGSSFSRSMPILDYDGKGILKVLRKDVEGLQAKFGLGAAWIYKTKRGYHVYFGSDLVSSEDYHNIVYASSCCLGFKKYVSARGMGVLRISAKYTEFDIQPHDLMIGPNTGKPARKLWPAVVLDELMALGRSSGTHLAALFPQWARFTEDQQPWNPRSKQIIPPIASPKVSSGKFMGTGVIQGGGPVVSTATGRIKAEQAHSVEEQMKSFEYYATAANSAGVDTPRHTHSIVNGETISVAAPVMPPMDPQYSPSDGGYCGDPHCMVCEKASGPGDVIKNVYAAKKNPTNWL